MHHGNKNKDKIKRKYWFPNGQLASHGGYINGEYDGEWKRWNPIGQLASHKWYIDGEVYPIKAVQTIYRFVCFHTIRRRLLSFINPPEVAELVARYII